MPAPRVPPAPPRLSITSCREVSLANCAESGLAKASVPPPAGKGTTRLTGRAGHALCPNPAVGTEIAAATAARSVSRRLHKKLPLNVIHVSSLASRIHTARFFIANSIRSERAKGTFSPEHGFAEPPPQNHASRNHGQAQPLTMLMPSDNSPKCASGSRKNSAIKRMTPYPKRNAAAT
jgi:hypothetical protein